eukprot:1180979-Prorocentrum_minimum.AAC.1
MVAIFLTVRLIFFLALKLAGAVRKVALKVADSTERTIDAVRLSYKPFAVRGAYLYFTVISTSNIDPMYQFSLGWFVRLFKASMDAAQPSVKIDVRLQNMKSAFLFIVYTNVCRSLFEKDKGQRRLLRAPAIKGTKIARVSGYRRRLRCG